MFELVDIIILIAGFIGAFVSGCAGGGAGLFITPVLIFVGIPPHVSIATMRLGALGLSIGSLMRFLRSGVIVWKLVIPFTLISIPAAIIGVYLVLTIPQTYVERIIGALLLFSAVAILNKPEKSGTSEHKHVSIGSYIVFFFARIMQAAFGSGSGLLVNVVYVKLMGLSLTEANATKRIPGFIVVMISLVIFGVGGFIDYRLGALLFVSMIAGSYTGAHFALNVNQKYIAYVFSALATIFGIALIV